MRHSVMKGVSFGLTSGTITTLGLMVGLNAGTGSRAVVIGGILTIAVADAFSDALGIHISEESEKKHTEKEIWAATFCTFISKFIFALTFLVPVLFLPLNKAVIAGIIWGVLVISALSIYIAKENNEKTYRIVLEHLFIAALVIVITYYVGRFVSVYFG